MKNLRSILASLCIFSLSTAFSAENVIHVFMVGTGQVGSELIQQIQKNFSADQQTEVRVVGLGNSRLMCFDPNGIALAHWKEQLAESDETMSLEAFVQRMEDLRLPHSVFVDCTTDQSVANSYQAILQSDIAIATPNKKANSGPFSVYSALKKEAEKHHVQFLYDANVGAGLPMIRTIQALNRSGDSVVKLEAILSGTLSYLFNTFDGTTPFSEIVKEAQKQGYTEPDPRDDLNGMDMARKFLILARESGQALEMADIVIQPFLPKECFEAASVSDFYKKLAEVDGTLSSLAKQAKEKGQVLRFVGTLENGKAVLSLKAVGPEHPFYQLSGTENIAAISSRIYSKNPIVIKGPGAGASITAASVLSDIIQAGLAN